jgi:hypothetical protein
VGSSSTYFGQRRFGPHTFKEHVLVGLYPVGILFDNLDRHQFNSVS